MVSHFNRREFLKTSIIGSACALLTGELSSAVASPSRHPNILWLDAEDANINWIGCYGNPAATTPNIDRLAADGFRYTHAFANAPVCSPSRSTWITGVLAVSMGTHNHRSHYDIPHDVIKYYPDYLKTVGYHVTLGGWKTDYNIGGRPDRQCWDEGRSWRAGDARKPFFHIEHFFQSHESRAFGDVDNTQHDPTLQRLRLYHPDITGVRNNYAHYADAVEQMDTDVGKVLNRLELDSLADDTIVIFTTDHGGVMPASKRFLTDSGIHAPFIVRIPKKFKHLWPAENPGMTVDRLVSFVDMPKTWLSIAGAEVPDHMQGRIFLGPDKEPERATHFAFQGRADARYDEYRAVRSKRFLYIKNYMPFVPPGKYNSYMWNMVAMQAWDAHHRAGKTDQITGRFFRPRSHVEELYDTHRDPDNIINIADRPEHLEDLKMMRSELRKWQLEIFDAGLLPEVTMIRRAGAYNITIYDMVRDAELYDLPAYLDASDLALEGNPENIRDLCELMARDDEGIRYWAVVGLLMLDELDEGVVSLLNVHLEDEANEVRAMAAWALIRADKEKERARACLRSLLEKGSDVTLLVLNIIDYLNEDPVIYKSAIPNDYESELPGNLIDRIKSYLSRDAS